MSVRFLFLSTESASHHFANLARHRFAEKFVLVCRQMHLVGLIRHAHNSPAVEILGASSSYGLFNHRAPSFGLGKCSGKEVPVGRVVAVEFRRQNNQNTGRLIGGTPLLLSAFDAIREIDQSLRDLFRTAMMPGFQIVGAEHNDNQINGHVGRECGR